MATPSVLRDASSALRDAFRNNWHRVGRRTSRSALLVQDSDGQRELLEPKQYGTHVGLTERETRDARVHALNMLLLVAGSMLVLTAVFGMQSLESSINSSDGLGEGCLALVYGLGVISVTFLAPVLLRRFGTQRIMRLCVVPLALFLAAHFRVMPATLIASCALFGMFFMTFMASISVLATSAAIDYAALYGVPRSPMIARFSSLLFVGLVFSYFSGPMISSLILHNPPADVNGTATAGEALLECTDSKAMLVVADRDLYILLSVYLVLIMVAFVIFSFIASASQTTIQAKLAKSTARQQITATIRLVGDLDLLLCIPWIIFTGTSKEMITANYTEFFVAPCLGIAKVGFSIAAFGASNTIITALMPYMLKRAGRPILAAVATSLELIVMFVMLYWKRSHNAALLYSLPAMWGAADAIWNVEMSVVLGVVFARQQEAAFSNYRAWQGFGFGISALCSSRFLPHMEQLHTKLYVLIALLLFSMLLYGVVEGRIRRSGKEAGLDFVAVVEAPGAVQGEFEAGDDSGGGTDDEEV